VALRCKSSSFPKLNVEKFLLVKFGINRLPNLHVVDRYFDAVKALGVVNDNKGLDYFPSAADAAIAEKLPTSFANKYTAVVCGALQGTKRIPEEKLLNYCNAIRGNIVFVGGPAEAELGARLEGALGNRSISFCGKTSIGESAVLLQNANSVLTPDTGMMHLAAAFKKPIAVVWGNTIPAFGMGPYMPDKSNSVYNAEVPGLKCRPCSKIGFNACPKKHFNCMHLQQAEPLIHWINSVNEAV
jgi:ADP-heptose:LPS heptosyltransferase